MTGAMLIWHYLLCCWPICATLPFAVNKKQKAKTMKVKIAPKTISQHLMKQYMELAEQAKMFEDCKKKIVALAKGGLSCQPGPYSCHLDTVTTTSVSWKKEFVKMAGDGAAEEIMDHNRGNSSRSTLKVSHRDQVVD